MITHPVPFHSNPLLANSISWPDPSWSAWSRLGAFPLVPSSSICRLTSASPTIVRPWVLYLNDGGLSHFQIQRHCRSWLNDGIASVPPVRHFSHVLQCHLDVESVVSPLDALLPFRIHSPCCRRCLRTRSLILMFGWMGVGGARTSH